MEKTPEQIASEILIEALEYAKKEDAYKDILDGMDREELEYEYYTRICNGLTCPFDSDQMITELVDHYSNCLFDDPSIDWSKE